MPPIRTPNGRALRCPPVGVLVLERDRALVIVLFVLDEQAAERGNTQAMVRIARMHALGIGTKKSLEAAVAWLGKAVDQGDGIAMQTLAKIYDEGAGVRKDPAAVADLVIRAPVASV